MVSTRLGRVTAESLAALCRYFISGESPVGRVEHRLGDLLVGEGQRKRSRNLRSSDSLFFLTLWATFFPSPPPRCRSL